MERNKNINKVCIETNTKACHWTADWKKKWALPY